MFFANNNKQNQQTVETIIMDKSTVIRLKKGLTVLLAAGLLGLGMSLMLPDSSEAQQHPAPPQRSAPSSAPMSGPTPPAPPGPPAQTPIDGGLGLLLAAGGAYGLNKLRKRRKEEINH